MLEYKLRACYLTSLHLYLCMLWPRDDVGITVQGAGNAAPIVVTRADIKGGKVSCLHINSMLAHQGFVGRAG